MVENPTDARNCAMNIIKRTRCQLEAFEEMVNQLLFEANVQVENKERRRQARNQSGLLYPQVPQDTV